MTIIITTSTSGASSLGPHHHAPHSPVDNSAEHQRQREMVFKAAYTGSVAVQNVADMNKSTLHL